MPIAIIAKVNNVTAVLNGPLQVKLLKTYVYWVVCPISKLNGKKKKTAGGLMDGNDVKGIPHWQSNLGLEWDVQPVEGLTLTANTTYTGSLYANDTNTQKKKFQIGLCSI